MTEPNRPAVHLELTHAVGMVTLDRPQRRNAIGADLVDGLVGAIATMRSAAVRVAVLRASGPVFCAGADLREPQATAAQLVDRLLDSVADSELFWIAQVDGGCVGAGVALALACPAVYATTPSWFATPELSAISRFPVSVVSRLVPSLGLRSAYSLGVTEQRVDAARAYGLGWLTWAGTRDELPGAVSRAVAALAGADPSSVLAAVRLWHAAQRTYIKS